MLAEMRVTLLAPQCMLWRMLWRTSPAATGMETVMLDWLRRAVGWPGVFQGVFQDSAFSASLAAERDFEIVTPPILSLFTFRQGGGNAHDPALVEAVNADGRVDLTRARVDGQVVILFQAGAFGATEAVVVMVFDVRTEVAQGLG